MEPALFLAPDGVSLLWWIDWSQGIKKAANGLCVAFGGFLWSVIDPLVDVVESYINLPCSLSPVGCDFRYILFCNPVRLGEHFHMGCCPFQFPVSAHVSYLFVIKLNNLHQFGNLLGVGEPLNPLGVRFPFHAVCIGQVNVLAEH